MVAAAALRRRRLHEGHDRHPQRTDSAPARASTPHRRSLANWSSAASERRPYQSHATVRCSNSDQLPRQNSTISIHLGVSLGLG